MTQTDSINMSTQTQLMETPFETGGVLVNFNQNMLSRNNNEIVLQPKVFELLILLCAAQGKTLSKQSLVTALWPDTIVGPDSLANAMARLRKALSDDAKNPKYIQTVQRKGYRWLQPIQLLENPRIHSFKRSTIAVILTSIIFITAFWQLTKEEAPKVFPFPDLSITKLADGGYEVQVGIEGKLTEEKKAAMLKEIKRITGEEYSGMAFTLDPTEPTIDCKENTNTTNCKSLKK
jgi:DNA-binding winged helix-turn-helix (wHTH) protein